MGRLQSGLSVVTCMAICGGGTMVLFGFGMKPESRPPSIPWQGVSNGDWETVWFAAQNSKTTRSPTAAFVSSGE